MSAGLTQASMSVRELPPRESCTGMFKWHGVMHACRDLPSFSRQHGTAKPQAFCKSVHEGGALRGFGFHNTEVCCTCLRRVGGSVPVVSAVFDPSNH